MRCVAICRRSSCGVGHRTGLPIVRSNRMTGLNVRIHIENFFKDLAHSLRRVEPYDALKQGTIPCLDAPSFLGVFRLLCRCELRTASYGPTPAAVRDRRFSPLDNTVTVA